MAPRRTSTSNLARDCPGLEHLLLGAAQGASTFYPTKHGGFQDRGDKVLHLTGSDIFMHFESDVEFVGPTALIEEGTWALTGGTGIYAQIKGHGRNFILGDGVGGLFQGKYDGKIDVP